jgi:hypothetical protein
MRELDNTISPTTDLRLESAWPKVKTGPTSDREAAFAADASLAALDAMLRPNPVFAGAFSCYGYPPLDRLGRG